MSKLDEASGILRRGAVVLGGAHGSLEIARSLGRRGIPVWLITSDNPLAGLSRYVARSMSWPGSREDGAARYLIELGRRHRLDGWVLFAGSDEDLRFVAQNHDALGAVFTLTTPAWDKIRWTYDKHRMNVRAAELGIAVPRSLPVDDLADASAVLKAIGFPAVIKPYESWVERDGIGTRLSSEAFHTLLWVPVPVGPLT